MKENDGSHGRRNVGRSLVQSAVTTAPGTLGTSDARSSELVAQGANSLMHCAFVESGWARTPEGSTWSSCGWYRMEASAYLIVLLRKVGCSPQCGWCPIVEESVAVSPRLSQAAAAGQPCLEELRQRRCWSTTPEHNTATPRLRGFYNRLRTRQHPHFDSLLPTWKDINFVFPRPQALLPVSASHFNSRPRRTAPSQVGPTTNPLRCHKFTACPTTR